VDFVVEIGGKLLPIESAPLSMPITWPFFV
jgi:hypothetical protein